MPRLETREGRREGYISVRDPAIFPPRTIVKLPLLLVKPICPSPLLQFFNYTYLIASYFLTSILS